MLSQLYSKTCLKRPLSKRPQNGFQDQFLLNAALLSTFINASVKFARVVVRFICLRFSLRFFRHRRRKLRRMCLHCLRSPYNFFGQQNYNKTLQRPCGYRTTTARLSYNNRVILPTSLYKSHDAPPMTLRKSQGVGMLTVQVMYNYVHVFKRPSIQI